MFDRESQLTPEELAYAQQRFDIHVLAFADRSQQAVAALQEAFELDADTASRLIEQAPIVVKRRAPPEIADALLDALGQLGAQVVILPSPLDGDEPAAPADSGASSEPPAGNAPPAGDAPLAARWGGLELDLAEPARPRRPLLDVADLAVSVPAPPPHGKPVPTPTATGEDAGAGAEEDLEFDLGADPGDALGAGEERSELVVEAAAAGTATARPDLGLGTVPPLPPPPPSLPCSLPPPPPPLPPLPPPSSIAEAADGASLPRLPGRPPRAPAPPAVAPARAVPSAPRARSPRAREPARKARPAARARAGAPARKPQGPRTPAAEPPEQRLLELGPPVGALPKLELAPNRERPAPAAAPAKPETRPSAAPPPSRAHEVGIASDLLDSGTGPRPAPAPAAPQRSTPRKSRSPALLELVAGVLVFYAGLRIGNTVLHGNADLVSVAVHGLALYGIGSGLLGLVAVRAWWPLRLIVACGLSAGLDHVMEPAAPYALDAGERTMSTGSLWLQDGDRRHEFELINVYAVVADLPRAFADPLRVRELWLRSPEQGGAPPDLELFADLSGQPTPAGAGAPEVTALRGQSLPLLPQARGGDLHSRVRLPGASGPARVAEGRLSIVDAIAVGTGAPGQAHRIRAQLELVLGDGEERRTVTGELNARLVLR